MATNRGLYSLRPVIRVYLSYCAGAGHRLSELVHPAQVLLAGDDAGPIVIIECRRYNHYVIEPAHFL